MPLITCSNCGKLIPYEGKVCPFCHAEKSDAKKKHDFIGRADRAVVLGAIFGAIIGYQISLGMLCAGVFIGALVGLGISVVRYFFFR